MLQGRTLWELMERRVDATPDALMAVDEDMRTMTFAEFWAESELAAAGLAGLGVHEGDVVTWQLPTWIESMVLVAALARIGAVQNPVLPIYRERELSFIAEQAGSHLLVVPSVWRGHDYEAMATAVARGHDDLRVLVADRALPQGDTARLPPMPAELEPHELAVRWLFYTSGTTAEPKGAKHTDATIATAAWGMAQRLALIPADRNALVFPFTHIGGIIWMFASLQSGCSNILTEAFHPIDTAEVLSREGVTLAGSGTAFHQSYLAHQRTQLHEIFPEVRAFPGGGAPKPDDLVAEVRAVFDAPILSGYGLTECPILTMAAVTDADDELAVTEGRPLPGVEMRLIDVVDGSLVHPGEEGEIAVRAPQMMRGYVDPALETHSIDQDGFFKTGDIGYFDHWGNLVVTGRVKDVIVRKGENISAREVEELLFRHDQIADVAVIGLPDADSGERVCAVVQLSDGSDEVSFDDLVLYLTDAGLMVQKLPEQLEIVDSLPRNQAGKVLKHVLRDELKG